MTLPSERLLLWLMPVLWLLVLGSAVGAVYVKHSARERFVELERINRERDRLEIEWGRLQLEQSAWSTHAFVENVAGRDLKMYSPTAKQVEVITP